MTKENIVTTIDFFDKETRILENTIEQGSLATSELLFWLVGQAIGSGKRATTIYREQCEKAGRWSWRMNKAGTTKLFNRVASARRDANPTYRRTATVMNCLASMQSELKLYRVVNDVIVFNTEWANELSFLESIETEKEQEAENDGSVEVIKSEPVAIVEEQFKSILEEISEVAILAVENGKATKKSLTEALQAIVLKCSIQ